MGALIAFSMKLANGTYQNFTISVNDDTDTYGNNVSMWIEQSKEERDARARRTFIGNGKVIWTDGIIKLSEKQNKPGVAGVDLDLSNQQPTNQFNNSIPNNVQPTNTQNEDFNVDEQIGDDDLPF
jgi:hypothetical protein